MKLFKFQINDKIIVVRGEQKGLEGKVFERYFDSDLNDNVYKFSENDPQFGSHSEMECMLKLNLKENSINRLFKLHNLDPYNYAYARLIKDLEQFVEQKLIAAQDSNVLEQTPNNGETPLDKLKKIKTIYNQIEGIEPPWSTAQNGLYRIGEILKDLEDNPVGQTLIEDNLLYILRNHTKEAFPKNSIGEARLLNELINLLSKPVETDKEQPFYRIVCNIIPNMSKGINYCVVISEDYQHLVKRNNTEFKKINIIYIEKCTKEIYDTYKKQNPTNDGSYLKMKKEDYSKYYKG